MQAEIVLDSSNKIVKIECDGDIEVIAKANAILHANALKIGTSDGVSAKARSVLGHAAKTFGLKASTRITIGGGNTTINTSNAAATSVSGSGAGELGGAPLDPPQQGSTASDGGGAMAGGGSGSSPGGGAGGPGEASTAAGSATTWASSRCFPASPRRSPPAPRSGEPPTPDGASRCLISRPASSCRSTRAPGTWEDLWSIIPARAGRCSGPARTELRHLRRGTPGFTGPADRFPYRPAPRRWRRAPARLPRQRLRVSIRSRWSRRPPPGHRRR